MSHEFRVTSFTHYTDVDGYIRQRQTKEQEYLLSPGGDRVRGDVDSLEKGGWLFSTCTNQLFLKIPCTSETVQSDGRSGILSVFGKRRFKDQAGSPCSLSLAQVCNPSAHYYYNSLTMHLGRTWDNSSHPGNHKHICRVIRLSRRQHPRLPAQVSSDQTGNRSKFFRPLISGTSSMSQDETNAIDAAKAISVRSMSLFAFSEGRKGSDEVPKLPTYPHGQEGPSSRHVRRGALSKPARSIYRRIFKTQSGSDS